VWFTSQDLHHHSKHDRKEAMKNAISSTHDLVSLAKTVIKGHGASAGAFATRLRAANPDLHPHELADEIAKRYAKQAARVGVAAGKPSELNHGNAHPADPGHAVLLLRLQFRMLLEIAAVYGLDPADAERATELTAFCGPQRGADSARIVITRTGERLFAWLVDPRGILAALGLRQRHLQAAHGLTPCVGVGVGAVTYGASTLALARQAVNFYDPSPIAWDPTNATRTQSSTCGGDTSRVLRQ
jgi:hypothetical protein